MSSGDSTLAREDVQMAIRICTELKQLCTRFAERSDGAVLPTFTLSLIPIVAVVGAAVDYSRASSVRAL